MRATFLLQLISIMLSQLFPSVIELVQVQGFCYEQSLLFGLLCQAPRYEPAMVEGVRLRQGSHEHPIK
ncbi:hypothetical protein VAS14_09614 [Photobacterium angustum S14]|uniref:Uncharacterized protein n=1 Tax=Photobacterium angustum (strain S14 / CCUG 15956) TaxID=314292 RepID=Q1ZX02_PHOAS|nr:hypothetical protein VAS14_09614 [Photobacterium angustum S14]